MIANTQLPQDLNSFLDCCQIVLIFYVLYFLEILILKKRVKISFNEISNEYKNCRNELQIYVRSTKVDRTIASAKANMGGLFANESFAEFLERIRPNKMHVNKALDELFSLPGMQMFAVDSIEQGNVF